MSLEYDSAYHCRSALSLTCGANVHLKVLHQKMTYGGLLEGSPNARLNELLITRIVADAKKSLSIHGHPPFVIPPVRRDFYREPGDMDVVRRYGSIPEWMPMITCIGDFTSPIAANDKRMSASALAIIWFQDDYAFPISETALAAIQSIDWPAHAIDFEY